MTELPAILRRWALVPDGPEMRTATGLLLPVVARAGKAMLKLSDDPEEQRGCALLDWWGQGGAVRVIRRAGPALLMERAMGPGCLTQLSRDGRDAEACRVICDVAAQLHQPRPGPLPELCPLPTWFRALEPTARRLGGDLRDCAHVAAGLLADPQPAVALHGDLHHANVLDFGAAGWRAIDPKGLWGERAFDYLSLMINPDMADRALRIARDGQVFDRRVSQITAAAGLEPSRFLRWIAAWGGLSAAWMADDPSAAAASVPLEIARMALARL